MTSERRFEQVLPTLLVDLLAAPFPDYRDDVLAMTAHTRQRRAWTFPERWLPMELVTTRVPTPRVPWRLLGVVALVAILLSIAIAAYVGSHTLRLPPAFGPAANGQIAMARNGDLYTVDPLTGRETLIVGGPQQDDWVGFTPDGTRGVFVRWGPENGALTSGRVGSTLLKEGSTPLFVNKDVIHSDSTIELAPNGRDVAYTAYDYGTPNIHIAIAALDGSSFHTFEDVPIGDYGGLAFLAPDGRELVYLARAANGHTHDIRALDLMSGETRPIVETSVAADIFGNVSAAPDGKRIAYAVRQATGEVRVHVVGTDGGGDTIVGHASGATFEAWPQWDPQGPRLLIERDAGDGVVHPVIIDVAGGADVVVDTTISQNGAGKVWAPDGSSILAQRTAADGRQLQQELWDARTGAVTAVSWPSVTPPSWQRLAP